jgi:cysteinyl-tRNA synthetase
LANVLGLEVKAGDSIVSEQLSDQSDAEVDALVAQRNQARKDQNFAEADRIRKQLEAKGIELIDKKGATTWRYH